MEAARVYYRRWRSRLGLLYLRRARRRGLPEYLRAPLEYLLTERASPQTAAVMERVERLRAGLAQRAGSAGIYLTPRPGAARHSPGPLERITLERIARVTSILPYWGAFLNLCAESIRARVLFELGSGAGLSGCYLAAASSCTSFTTVEGSPVLAELARANLRHVNPEARVLNAFFDPALDEVLPRLDAPLDLVFIDGHREFEARLDYCRRLRPHLNRPALVLLDDIHSLPAMQRAWEVERRQAGWTAALDLGRMGLLVWEADTLRPRQFNFSPFTAWWARGEPRPAPQLPA
jgi:predicted O-methyltransferase YrrM